MFRRRPTRSSPRAFRRIRRRSTIEPSRDTRLVSVAFSAEDPALAARMANAHAEAYVEHGLSMRTGASRDALDFLVEQATELRQRVDAAQAKLAAYRAQHGIVALDDPQDDRPNAVLERLTELNKRLTEAETAAHGARGGLSRCASAAPSFRPRSRVPCSPPSRRISRGSRASTRRSSGVTRRSTRTSLKRRRQWRRRASSSSSRSGTSRKGSSRPISPPSSTRTCCARRSSSSRSRRCS